MLIFSLFIYFRVKLFEWLEQRKVEKLFYRKESFRQADLALLAAYQSKSPYKISKEFLKAKNASNIFIYGETPLTTMHMISAECGLNSTDTIIEMGAGRGRTSLFLAAYLGCNVTAYELIPAFVENIPAAATLKMIHGNMFSADFSKANVIYLYGTLLEDAEITTLAEAFPKGVKIITVSYPLIDYSQKYVTRKTFSTRFPWGKTEVYWNERIS